MTNSYYCINAFSISCRLTGGAMPQCAARSRSDDRPYYCLDALHELPPAAAKRRDASKYAPLS